MWVPQSATIENIVAETPGVRTYELRFDDKAFGEGYRFAAGQFNMLYAPGFGEAAISISSNPSHPARLSHTIRKVGDVTGALARLTPGESIALRGPFGAAWPMEELRGRDVVIAGGGIGLAPLRPVIYQVLENRADFGRVYLVYGARAPRDLLYAGQYDAWRAGGLEVAVTVDLGEPTWLGHIGVVPELMRPLKLDPQETRVLTCGPEIMMRFVALAALDKGTPAAHIYLSLERNMNCAVGLCGHCQLGPEFICKDGPVFRYDRIERYMRLEDL